MRHLLLGTKENRARTLFLMATTVCFALILVGYILGGLPENTPHDAPTDVRVTLADAEGVTFQSEQIVSVPMGGEVTFSFRAKEGIKICAASAGTLEDGKLTLSGIYAPTTVFLDTLQLASCDFEVIPTDRSLGGVTATLSNGKYYEGTEVSVVALPNPGTIFLGYSYGKPYSRGGEIVQTAEELRYAIAPDTQKLYANFVKAVFGDDPALTVEVPAGQRVVIYHPNGGINHFNPDLPYRQTTFSSAFYYCPNTLPNDGSFTREGYVLLGYNTKADGSGRFYAPGWNVIMPENRDAISLYCMWERVSSISDFTFSETSSGTWAVKGYHGKDERVVIPETYRGQEVTKIASSAFKNNAAMKTVVLPRTIREMSKNAFIGCKNLQTMYFSDSVKKAYDDCVSDCPALQTIHVMATRYPAYAGKNHGTFSVKFEKLISSKKLKLVVVSGSNTSHGIFTPQLEKLLLDEGYDFEVINFGTLAEATVVFPLEVISHFVGEGDVVVHQPEPNYDTQWGRSDFDHYTWTVFESAYDAFSYVDMRHYEHFFSSFAAFNSKRGKEVGYERYSKDYLDNNGEYCNLRDETTPALASKFAEYEIAGGGPLSFDQVAALVDSFAPKLNRVYGMIGETGALILHSFASTADVYLSAESGIPGGKMQKMLENKIDSVLAAERISDIATYVFPKERFYNSEYHLTTEGARVRTALFAKDLLAYLGGSH